MDVHYIGLICLGKDMHEQLASSESGERLSP